MRVRRVRPDTIALAATLTIAAAARFSWLDLMEFKGDEANACRLALHVLGFSEPGVGRFFPTAGLVSSIGITNPPLFVYVVAVPLAVVRSPIAGAVFVAAANVLAVWLTYVAGKRCFSRFVGLAAAALLALSPWGIVFSRKIWAQDLLPLCTTLLILQIHALLVRKQPRAAFWVIVITGAAVQLHFSACVLVAVSSLALVLARRTVDWRWVVGGLIVTALLYMPYLAFHAGAILHTAVHHHAYTGPGLAKRFRACLRFMLGIVGGGSMAYLIGKGSTLATLCSALLGVAAPVGLIAAAKRQAAAALQLALLFCIWYSLPLTILTIFEIRPYMHYFIVLMPLPYLGIAYVIEYVFVRRAIVGTLALAAALCCFMLIDARFFHTVIHDGGAPGDYGIAYRFKQQAVTLVLRRAAGRPFSIGTDLDFQPVKQLNPYRFLLWNANPEKGAPRGAPRTAYVLLDTFNPLPPLLRSDPMAATYPRTALGPLTIVTIPPRAIKR